MATKKKQKELLSFTALKAVCDALPPMTLDEYRQQAINNMIGIVSDEEMLAPEPEKEARRRFIQESFPGIDNPILKARYEQYLDAVIQGKGE